MLLNFDLICVFILMNFCVHVLLYVRVFDILQSHLFKGKQPIFKSNQQSNSKFKIKGHASARFLKAKRFQISNCFSNLDALTSFQVSNTFKQFEFKIYCMLIFGCSTSLCEYLYIFFSLGICDITT